MKYLPVLKHIVLLAKNKNAGVMRYAFIQTYVKGFVDALKITDPKYPGIPELERIVSVFYTTKQLNLFKNYFIIPYIKGEYYEVRGY